jgi:hypothetical protein
MANVITLADVRTLCGILSGVENNKLQPWLDTAEIRLEKILGRTGMASLRAAYASDPTFAQGANADWLALKVYIDRYLAWQTYHLALPSLHSQPERAGFFSKGKTQGGETFDSIDVKTLSMHEGSIRTALETHQARLLEKLQMGDYTWYTTNVDGEPRIEKTNSVGISFRRSRWQNPQGIPSTDERE